MATGEMDGSIKLWSTDDYSQLMEAREVFEESVFPMRFVDGSNDTIVALDNSGRLKEFVIDVDIDRVSSNHGMRNISIVRDEVLTKFTILWCHMAKAGRNLVYSTREIFDTVSLCSLSDSEIHRREVFVDDESQKFPVLSDDASSLLACNMPFNDNRDDCPHVVYVWPRLDAAAASEDPAVLTGRRAVWGLNGQYVIVLSDPLVEPYLISVYRTDDLNPGTENQPWRQTRFSFGMHNFQAHMLDAPHPGMHPRLLVCEIGKSEMRRVTEWDLEDNKITREYSVEMPMQRTIEHVKRISGPRLGNKKLGKSMFASLGNQCVEVDWKLCDIRAHFFVAQEDVYPKFCISQDEKWISIFSWKRHSCSILSSQSGTCVWSFSLPEDIWWDPSVMLNEVAFDPCGHHLLVFGDKCIYACSPFFMAQPLDEVRMSVVSLHGTITPPEIKLPENILLGYDMTYFAETTLLQVCNGRPAEYPDDVAFGTSLLLLNYGFVDYVAERVLPSVLHTLNVKGCCECPSSSFDNLNVLQTADQIYFTRGIPCLFDDDAQTFLVCQGLAVLLDDYDLQPFVFNPSVDGCFSLNMNQSLRKVSILEKRAVCMVKLSRTMLESRIDYLANFETLTQLADAASKWRARGRWTGEFYTGRCISEDGRMVLLGWDTKNRRSIIARPDTPQDDCKQLIEESRGYLSDFCCLSRSGGVTLFTDVDELEKGKLSVGIFDEKDRKVRGMYDVISGIDVHALSLDEKQRLLRCLFFDVNDDCSKLATFVAPQHKALEEYPVENAIKIFKLMDRERASCSACAFLFIEISSFCRDLQRFGLEAALNMPDCQGNSIFQQAFLNGSGTTVQAIVALAQMHQDFKLGLEWTKDSGERSNVLSVSLQKKSPADIKTIIDLIGNGRTPFSQTAALMKQNITDLLLFHPKLIEEALSNDRLVVEVCQVKVHPDYLDPTIRRNSALHIHMGDTTLEWKIDGCPETNGERWKEEHREEVEAMEQRSNRQRETAMLKAVCLEDAAGIGMNGIVRRLLMHKLSEHVFKSALVKWVVQFKWFKIWRERFTWMILQYLTFLAFFTAYTVSIGSSASISDDVMDWVLLTVNVVFGLIMFREEILQMTNFTRDGRDELSDVWWGLKYFFSSKWNWVDVASCTLLVVVIPSFHLLSVYHPEYEIWLSAFAAIEAILSSIKVWYFAQPFRNTGALVLLINNVVKECMAFLLLAFVVLFGFALALHVSSRHAMPEEWTDAVQPSPVDIDVNDAFETFPKSLLTLFYAMTGTIDTEDYDFGDLRWLRKAIVVVYMSVQMIMLLNLLIAIMEDTFDKVKNTEEEQMLMARAQFIDASEAGLTKKQKRDMEKKIGKYVFALVPISAASEMDERRNWLGRVQEMERSVRKQVKESEQRLLTDINKKIEDMYKHINDRDEAVNDRMHGIEEAMKAMKEQLADILEAVKLRERD